MASENYTCITCQLIFPTLEEQRNHYRTASHCFNLKRKVAHLPPITEQLFHQKVQQLKDKKMTDEVHTNVKGGPKRDRSKKSHKFRKGKNRSQNRINLTEMVTPANEMIESTQKFLREEAEKGIEEEQPEAMIGVEEKTEEELIEERLRTAQRVPITESLFDSHPSRDMASNLEYMRAKFGFFLPIIDCLIDLEGLITYLGEKVGIGYSCLWCDKEFNSLGAARSHMIDKSHCKIAFYGHEEEFAEFYDLTPLGFVYEDDEEEEKKEEKSSEGVIVPREEGERQPKKEIVAVGEAARHYPIYGFSPDSFQTSAGELILPRSGSTAGNRLLKRYYRQKLKPVETKSSILVGQLVKQYQELGYLKVRSHVYEKDRKGLYKYYKQREKVGVKANKLQKHFRPQVNV